MLADLDRRRATAFATGRADGLEAVYVAGSRARAADRATLRAYDRQGLRVERLRLVVVTARPLDRPADGAVRLRVTDRMASYRLVDRRGRLVRVEPGRGEVTWRLALRTVHGSWRIAAVTRT